MPTQGQSALVTTRSRVPSSLVKSEVAITRAPSVVASPVHLQHRQTAARTAAGSGGAGGFGAYIPREDMERLLESVEPTSLIGMLLRALWQSGARIAEMLALTVADVHYAHGTIRLQTLKRGRNPDGTKKAPVFRLVPVQADLLGYFGIRVGLDFLKPADRFWPYSERWAYEQIRRSMRAVGFPENRCHPHAIRHGHAIAALIAGVQLQILSQNLGHSSITTTAVYLQFTIEDRKAAYRGVF